MNEGKVFFETGDKLTIRSYQPTVLDAEKIQEIGFYESFNFNVPDYYRVTEYSHELAQYKIKSNVTEEAVQSAYEKAVVYRDTFDQPYIDKWEKEHKEMLPDDVKKYIHNLIKAETYYHNMEAIVYRTLDEYERFQSKERGGMAGLCLDSNNNIMPVRKGMKR